MSDAHRNCESGCDCGCCAGHAPPELHFNAPGLPAISYRIGRHADFKAALLAGLSSSALPALAGLQSRADDDFSIACCDAGAVLLDVLSFYQERIANEAYLRTAVERRSIVEMARLIGYRPAPGVAASTQLAFQLEEAPGQPALAALPVTIPAGTRVQSVPGPGEEAQTFETVEAVTARVHWNAIPAQRSEAQALPFGTRELFLDGVSTQLQPGDMLLLVGAARLADPASRRWAVRPLTGVETDNERKVTRVSWNEGLGENNVQWSAGQDVRAYALRARGALFGHSAPDPRLLKLGAIAGITNGTIWFNYWIQNGQIDLDTPNQKITAGGWAVLAGGGGTDTEGSLPGGELLLRIGSVRHLSRNAYGLSGRITRLTGDNPPNTTDFPLRDTLVLAQSEELKLAPRLLPYPAYGAELALERRVADLQPRQALALSGKRQRLRVSVEDPNLRFRPDGAGPAGEVAARPGDSFIVLAPPTWLWSVFSDEAAVPPAELEQFLRFKGFFTLRWRVQDRNGVSGVLDASPFSVALQPAFKEDPTVSELRFIGDAPDDIVHGRDRTTVQLDAPLQHVYERATLSACANLARATQGESVGEVAGSGDASLPGQRFGLRQVPLTYVSAATPDGREAALQVLVDGQPWKEAASLYQRSSNEHVYTVRQDDEQRSWLQFGDGSEGARLPSGQDNVRLSYRKGLGTAGNVRANQLTTLLGRPLGVRSASNPVAASGGQDRESRDEARRNAPLGMLTLGRAVSLQDYTDYARSFAGVAKALASWAPAGRGRGIYISIAGPGGTAIAADSATRVNLSESLRRYGDVLLPLHIHSYKPVHFRVKAKVKVLAGLAADTVLKAAAAALAAHFAFDRREFLQAVSIDEVMAVLQVVSGVEAIDVDLLYRLDTGAAPALKPRLFALPPQLLADGSLGPAELLTLEPAPPPLELMP